MKILFLGNEEDYKRATRGSGSLATRSLFFAPSLECVPPARLLAEFDCIVMPVALLPNEKLRQSDQAWPLPLLASGEDAHMEEAYSLGCADFLREPWSDSELEARVRRHTRLELNEGRVKITGSLISGPAGTARLTQSDLVALKLLNANRARAVPRVSLGVVLSLDPATRAIDMKISRLRRLLKRLDTETQSPLGRAHKGCYVLI